MSKEFLITGGFLDDSYDAFLGKLTLTEGLEDDALSFELIKVMESPDQSLRVLNKGFTGGSIYKNTLWVCSSNQIFSFSLDNFKVEKIIDNPLFNDLHYVLAEKEGLCVVNTGLESIDLIDYNGNLTSRKLLISDEISRQKLRKNKDFRTVDSNPHFMHANYCYRTSEGSLLLTCLRQNRVVNTKDWEWASPLYPTPPHEGFIHQYHPENKECLWVSTVSGQVIASDPATFETIKKWDLLEMGLPPAWFRGLCVLEHGLLVGATRIIESNVGYYFGWGDNEVETSKSHISYIPFNTLKPVYLEIIPERITKIFSIIPMQFK